MIDVKHEVSQVRRVLGSRVIEAGEARVITISRSYPGELEDVWDAVTNPERLPRWFAPVSGELRLGGRFQVEGNAGGTIERCDPPRSFAATWEFGGQTSWIEVRLSESDGQVTLELEHVGHVDEDFWAQYGPGAVGIGWDLAVLGLALYLRGEGMTPEESQAWTTTDEYREFVALASEQWRQASVAGGTPEPDARAAAERCTAFYTGAEPPASDH
jgi:uncharacterized protein YndB with AHSA1/START domain